MKQCSCLMRSGLAETGPATDTCQVTLGEAWREVHADLQAQVWELLHGSSEVIHCIWQGTGYQGTSLVIKPLWVNSREGLKKLKQYGDLAVQ